MAYTALAAFRVDELVRSCPHVIDKFSNSPDRHLSVDDEYEAISQDGADRRKILDRIVWHFGHRRSDCDLRGYCPQERIAIGGGGGRRRLRGAPAAGRAA